MFESAYIRRSLNEFIRQIKCEYDFDVVILMARKLYSLYRSCKGAHSEHQLVITHEAIPFFYDQLGGKRVLIVDDIMIHGRTVKQFWDLLKDHVKEIHFEVFAISDDCNSLVADIDDSLQEKTAFKRSIWRNISREIVNKIRTSLTPIRSASCFLTIQDTYNTRDITTVIERLFSSTYSTENEDPEFSNVKTQFTYFSPGERLSNLSNKLVAKVVLQIDYLEGVAKSTKAVIAPHIFLKPMHEDDLSSLWIAFGFKDTSTTEYRKAQYRFIKLYISKLVCNALKAELLPFLSDEKISVMLDDSDMQYFLPKTLLSEVSTTNFADRFVSTIDDINLKEYTLNSNSANIMESLYQHDLSFYSNIADCGFADELLFQYPVEKRRPVRIEGARICYLHEKFDVEYTSIVEALSQSIATLSHELKSKWITERVLPGEQAYLDLLLTKPEGLIEFQLNAIGEHHESANEFQNTIQRRFVEISQIQVENRVNHILQVVNSARANAREPIIETNQDDVINDYISYLVDINVF